MLLAGFAIAFAATGALGWGQVFGQAEVLRTDGIFGYSRNSIYLATWLGLAGWALLLPSALLIGVLICWGALYVVAIFLEERWLAQV
jgi:protein-S-isoprenylcysteine O-methyltransferase Ste14